MKRKAATERPGKALALMLLFILSLSPTLIASCGGQQQAPPPAFSPEKVDALDQALDDFMAANAFPGLIVGIWAPDEGTYIATRGLASTGPERAMLDTCRASIGSCTKEFTATLILQLVEEGKLGLEDPLSGFFPQAPNADLITVRMLLTHTSGYPEHAANPRFRDTLAQDPLKVWTIEDLIDAEAVGVDLYPPGSSYHYSNLNYQLLGGIVEQVTGDPLPEVMRARILEPLGMDRTYYWKTLGDPPWPEDGARGYITYEGEAYDITEAIDPTSTGAAGAIVSDLYDMETWSRANGRGDLLQPATQEVRLTWTDLEDPPAGLFMHGYGIVYDHGFLGFHGAYAGFQSTSMYLPERDAVMVILSNDMADLNAPNLLFNQLAEIAFPEEHRD